MHKLLIATTNPGKLDEIRKYLSDLPIELVGLKDLNITDKIEEAGTSFKDNAILKAKFYAQKSGLPALADDGGFEIDALHGEPGVKSHRWIHDDREDTDDELIEYALEKMKSLSRARRGAQLHLVLALVLPNGKIHTVEEMVRGIVPEIPSSIRVAGFPYRTLLFFPEIGKFYNELSEEEHERFNHRKKALEKLKFILRRYLNG